MQSVLERRGVLVGKGGGVSPRRRVAKVERVALLALKERSVTWTGQAGAGKAEFGGEREAGN